MRKASGYIGAYIGDDLKETLQQSADSEHRTLSHQVIHLLDMHFKGKNAERQACAAAVCDQCKDAVELLYTEQPLTGNPDHRRVTGWVHRHSMQGQEWFEYCEAHDIYERSRLEALKA